MHIGRVPSHFGISYTIPLDKGHTGCNRKLSVQDFMGISISPVVSKIFEHCILRRFTDFVNTITSLGFKNPWDVFMQSIVYVTLLITM